MKLASMSERTDEKINDLQLAVAKMRQQQEELQKKLKQEHDKKEKLEVGLYIGFLGSVKTKHGRFVENTRNYWI